jgi:hypothetical protein
MKNKSEAATETVNRPARSQEPVTALTTWIHDTVRPDMFGTFLIPIRRNSRDPQFYLSLWTRQAEAALFGARSLHISTYEGRCLWLMVNETGRECSNRSAEGLTLNHFHALGRFPRSSPAAIGGRRPMIEERESPRPLTRSERCARMEQALKEASRRTPEAYRADTLRPLDGADMLPLAEN